MPSTETTPLLWSDVVRRDTTYRSRSEERLPYWRQDESINPIKHKDLSGNNPHEQFCTLTGCPPSHLGRDQKYTVNKKSLYGRATSLLASQRRAYNFSASLSNILLLSQVMIGAALTALGASASSNILITIFGATNTIIAGLVAYLKSRGQPMRARMFRDDLERIVDEIENSEVMWRGISEGVHGYEEIDTDEVTVRSEVARLTRLYERAVRLNGMNNPDMYMAGAGGFDGHPNGGVRPSRSGLYPGGTLPAVTAPAAPQSAADISSPAVPIVPTPEDAAPATKVIAKIDTKPEDESSNDEIPIDKGKTVDSEGAQDGESSSPIPELAPVVTPALIESDVPQTPTIAVDPDASPATAAHLKPKRTQSATGPSGGLNGVVKP